MHSSIQLAALVPGVMARTPGTASKYGMSWDTGPKNTVRPP